MVEKGAKVSNNYESHVSVKDEEFDTQNFDYLWLLIQLSRIKIIIMVAELSGF